MIWYILSISWLIVVGILYYQGQLSNLEIYLSLSIVVSLFTKGIIRRG